MEVSGQPHAPTALSPQERTPVPTKERGRGGGLNFWPISGLKGKLSGKEKVQIVLVSAVCRLYGNW